jgi:hypothetical protein
MPGINFRSTAYDWLVIVGGKAKFQGHGTINGKGEYGFYIIVIDGKIRGGEDRIRIKIWNAQTGEVVYDTMMGGASFVDPDIELGGGSIVIHKTK